MSRRTVPLTATRANVGDDEPLHAEMSEAVAVLGAAPRSRISDGWWVEATVAIVVAALLALISTRIPPGTGMRSLDPLGYTSLIAAGLAMGACRRLPRTATVVVTVVLCVFIARHYPDGPVWLTGWVAIAAVSWQSTRRAALIAAIAMLAALTAAARGFSTTITPLVPLLFVGWLAVAVLLGEALRNRRVRLAGLAERARFLERSREQVAARRVAEERLRIARDLHDSVAHAMATINVQAGAALHVLGRRPEAAGEALSVIQRASRDVLDELGAMLTLLRDEGGHADRAPTPELSDITRLVDGTRKSGLHIAFSQTGSPDGILPVVGTAAYRVVQEALTNVLRHSGAREVRVVVTQRPGGALAVEITDPGPPVAEPTCRTGVGLRGMTERVTATGGRLEAGPTAMGGFRVLACWDTAP